MTSNKITSLSNGSASSDAAAYGQVSPLYAYRRPNLVYISANSLTIQTGLVDGSSSAAQGETQLTVEQEIEVLKNRIEQLESEVKQNNAAAAESIKDAAALTAAEKRSRAETWSG